jgi:hypothetical protein
MDTASGSTVAGDLGVPAASLVAAHRPACWLRGKGRRRYPGLLEEEVGGHWKVRLDGPAVGDDLTSARRLELELRADDGLRRQLGVPPFPVLDFEVDVAGRQVRLRQMRFEEEQARLFRVQDRVPFSLTGGSISDRTLVGEVEALAPYEVLASVTDSEHLLCPGAIVRLEVARPWGATFRLHGRIACLERGAESTRAYLRLLDRSSVDEAGLLAACECPGFGMHTVWTYQLEPRGLDRVVRVSQAATPVDMVKVFELRRTAGQFFGQRPEANDWHLWSDPLDGSSILVLVSVGTKPIGTIRLVVNGGDRSKSEIEQAHGLPAFLWDESFVEVSKMALEPSFRGVGLRLPLWREAHRLARSLGVRYAVFESIPELVPVLEGLGAARLDLSRTPPDSLRPLHAMVLDLRQPVLRSML